MVFAGVFRALCCREHGRRRMGHALWSEFESLLLLCRRLLQSIFFFPTVHLGGSNHHCNSWFRSRVHEFGSFLSVRVHSSTNDYFRKFYFRKLDIFFIDRECNGIDVFIQQWTLSDKHKHHYRFSRWPGSWLVPSRLPSQFPFLPYTEEEEQQISCDAKCLYFFRAREYYMGETGAS